MQFGAATFASDTSSIHEVTGGAAILLDPKDIKAWAQAMLALEKNKIQRILLKQKSLERSKVFNWKQSAHALLQTYEEVLAVTKRNRDKQ